MVTDTSDTPPSTTPEGRLTHCPTCGMKISRDDLSLCSYCGAPVQLGEQKARISALQKRLSKMPEHKNYELAMSWQPPESPEFVRGMNERSRAGWAIGGAILFAAWAGLALFQGTHWILEAVIAVALLLFGLSLATRGKKRCVEATSMPLLRRAAIVNERRSETTFQGAKGETVYFFELEFVDGGKAEFRQPGKGAQHEPLVNGNTGVAYTRGQELLDFKVLRV